MTCDPSCLKCNGSGSENCTGCNVAEGLYLDDGNCVEECSSGKEPNDDTGECEEDESVLAAEGYPVYALIAETIILVALVFLSYCIKTEDTELLPNLLALLGIVEISERVMLMGFLWFEENEYNGILFGTCGGLIMGSVFLSMMFNILYLEPLVETSETLNRFVDNYKKSFYSICYLSFPFGLHFVRLLYGGLFASPALTIAKILGKVGAFRIPLERVSILKLILFNLPSLLQ